MKLVVLSVANSGLADLAYAWRELSADAPGQLRLQLFYAAKPLDRQGAEQIQQAVAAADFLLLDLMGAAREYEELVLRAASACRGQIAPLGGDNDDIRALLRLGGFTGRDMGSGKSEGSISPDSLQKMMSMAEKLGTLLPVGKLKDMKNYVQLVKYWKNASEENCRSLLCLIGRDYGGLSLPKPRAPMDMADTGILDPAMSCCYAGVAEYRRAAGFDAAKPTVAVLFYGHSYPVRTRGCVAAFIDKLKPFANVLPVAFARATSRDLARLRELLAVESGGLDLIVSFLSFRLGAGPMGGDAETAVRLLRELDVPVLHPFFMTRRQISEWQASPQGINPAEFLVQIMLPELDGCIETVPVGGLDATAFDDELALEIQELRLIEERADKAVRRIERWLNLRRKPNAAKKIAVICYNYPPGEDNVFGGAFLDTLASLAAILAKLADAGYTLEAVNAEKLREIFMDGKLVNSGRWAGDTRQIPFIRYSGETYRRRLAQPPWLDALRRLWGEAPGEIMSEEQNLLIPGAVFGNVFVGLQPSRGIHEQPDKFYHDQSLPPHHQYIAFYQWLRHEFQADAIIHVGTHGTLEFLPGKECGLSGDCLPDYLVGDMPHIYLYYAGNPAEAMIAKRRSHALLVSYQAPAFCESELYGKLAELDNLLQARAEAARIDPQRLPALAARIGAMAASLNLPADEDELEQELYRLRRSLIPHGLHIFGQGYNAAEAAAYMRFILRYGRAEAPALQRIVAEDRGLDYDELLAGQAVTELAALDQAAAAIAAAYATDGALPSGLLHQERLRPLCEQVLAFGYNACQASRSNNELVGLAAALDGRYLPARLAGDMIRNPAVLPSGYNLYQFDPRQVPAPAAMEKGAVIGHNTLEQYRAAHGCYPRSMAVVLWGLETSRTQGETVGQILYYLGVRTVNKKNQFFPTFAIIPQAELGRPRVDVVVTICGFFRDLFPLLIDALHAVFQQLAELDEPAAVNYLKAHTADIHRRLLAEGYPPEAAAELAAARIFGPAQAEYGSKVSKLIELKTWSEEQELAATYVASLQHVYSRRFRGQTVSGLLTAHLAAVDVVSQIRSNHEYELVDLDHYYEYVGGLAKSVEAAKGRKAAVYVSDTTAETVTTEPVGRSIARGVRTRLLNPKWINAMLEHSYHGVQKINDRFENVLGLAATTNSVENWIFSGLHQTYVADTDLRRRLTANNRWAYYGMLERLLECHKRGYWQPSAAELAELRQAFLQLEGDIEDE